MRTTSRIRSRSTLIALGTAVVALAGCDSVAETATEQLVEEAAGADDVAIDADSGEVRIETSEGTFQTGGDLPDDFPEDVPLPDGGELVTASSQSDAETTVWTAAWSFTEGDPQERLEEYLAAFEDAGWSVSEDEQFSAVNESGGMASRLLTRDTSEATVGFLGENDDYLVNVTVTRPAG